MNCHNVVCISLYSNLHFLLHCNTEALSTLFIKIALCIDYDLLSHSDPQQM